MKRNLFTGAMRAHAIVVVTLGLFAAGPVAAQIVGYKADPQGKDELWDVTSKMEMAGMPFAMPAQTNRVCVEKGNDAGTIPKNDGCKVVETNRSGNRFTYKMACKDNKNDYIATGESTSTGNGYQGKMRMVGKMDGQQMDMAMSYTGARAGNCTSTIKQEVAVMKAQSDKQIADSCHDAMDKLVAMYFFSEPKAMCQGQQKEFCAAVGRAAQSMQEPGQYTAMVAKNGDVKTSFAKCNADFAATTRAACGRASGSRNWRFVGGGNCDDDVRTLGKSHCEGRGSSPDAEFYPLCARYVTITRGNAAASASAPAAQPARAPAAPDSVQQGLDAVKKLLPF